MVRNENRQLCWYIQNDPAYLLEMQQPPQPKNTMIPENFESETEKIQKILSKFYNNPSDITQIKYDGNNKIKFPEDYK